MFGRETFIVRIAEDAMAPRGRAGDYVWVDPDEPAADGRLVTVRSPVRCPAPSRFTANRQWPHVNHVAAD